MKFSIKDFSSKCEEIRRKLRTEKNNYGYWTNSPHICELSLSVVAKLINVQLKTHIWPGISVDSHLKYFSDSKSLFKN